MQKRFSLHLQTHWLPATLAACLSLLCLSCDSLTSTPDTTANPEEGDSADSEEAQPEPPKSVVESFTGKLRDSFNRQKEKLEQTFSPDTTPEEITEENIAPMPELEEIPEPPIQRLSKEWLPAGVSRGQTNPDEAGVSRGSAAPAPAAPAESAENQTAP